MRKQHHVARALALIATLIVGTAQAQGPAGPPGAPPGKGKPGGDADHGKADHGKPDMAGAAALGKDKDKGKPDDKDKPGDKDKPDDKDKGPGAGHGPGHHGMRELLEDLKTGKLKKGEIKERLSALHDRREERMKEHREELKARFGASLAMPAAHEELEHHARRMAKLDRAMLLTETEVTKDKDKLKDRIQKLIAKENERHEAAMARLKSMPTTPAASAGAAASAAPAAASAAVKAGDK
jgi:hypothetical protein